MIILTKTHYIGNISVEHYWDRDDFFKIMREVQSTSRGITFTDWLYDNYNLSDEDYEKLSEDEKYEYLFDWNVHDYRSYLVIDDEFLKEFITDPVKKINDTVNYKHEFPDYKILQAISDYSFNDKAIELADEMLSDDDE